MKLSEKWLREVADPGGDTEALVHQLTMQGLEVESVESVAPPLNDVVVGRVVDVQPHPNADRLRVCKVDVHTGILQIVCGAPNVRPGGLYPVARIGGRLPGDLIIKPAKLRGVASEGMLCSAMELGLASTPADGDDGLLALADDAEAGMPLVEAMGLDDRILDLKITPNRADCFSVVGIARDLAATSGARFNPPGGTTAPVTIDAAIDATLEDVADCPSFVTRVVRGIAAGSRTPFWLREKLRRSGIRSIHPVVDVMNFVMIELGQPLHAYDLPRLSGGLQVRRARPGERLELLTGGTVDLDQQILVIADDRGPVGMAGIMGGSSTAVSAATRDIVIESADFIPATIAGRARRFGLQTDAATRFERGVDPAGQRRAIERATTLLLEITGGEAGPVTATGAPAAVREGVRLRRDRLALLLGQSVPDSEVDRIFRALGMESTAIDEGWNVTPPSFRFDISVEVDLIEEVARVHGYGNIAEVTGRFDVRLGTAAADSVPLDRVRDLLVDRDYQEAITYSFISRESNRQFSGAEGIALQNPLSAQLEVMRQSLWPGLIEATCHNVARQQKRVRLFEIGHRYLAGGSEVEEIKVVAGIAFGSASIEQWDVPAREVDYFDVKGDIEALLALTGHRASVQFVSDRHEALQPGRTARLVGDSGEAGWIGSLHPALVKALELPSGPVLFELRTSTLLAPVGRRFTGMSRFPVVRRDLAIVVPNDVAVGALMSSVAGAAGSAFRDVVLFDVFAGERIEAGHKSVALGLILQETSRTLTDAEIDRIIGGVVRRLASDFNARIRD